MPRLRPLQCMRTRAVPGTGWARRCVRSSTLPAPVYQTARAIWWVPAARFMVAGPVERRGAVAVGSSAAAVMPALPLLPISPRIHLLEGCRQYGNVYPRGASLPLEGADRPGDVEAVGLDGTLWANRASRGVPSKCLPHLSLPLEGGGDVVVGAVFRLHGSNSVEQGKGLPQLRFAWPMRAVHDELNVTATPALPRSPPIPYRAAWISATNI